MKESFCEIKFAVLSAAQNAWLTKFHAQYVTNIGSEDAPQFLKALERHFEITINGAQTVEALEMLKELPVPDSLKQKLEGKLSLFKKVQAKAARVKTARKKNDPIIDNALPA